MQRGAKSAFKDRGILKFPIRRNGIVYGWLTLDGLMKWQENQKLTNPVAAEVVSLRRQSI